MVLARPACSVRRPRLLDRVRLALRARHYSRRTESAYVNWIRRFILFHGKRHPAEMAEPEINAFLTHLAVKAHVGASTQNQVLSALLFLYRLWRHTRVEVGGGLGPLAGKMWRIGLMGHSSRRENVELLLAGLGRM